MMHKKIWAVMPILLFLLACSNEKKLETGKIHSKIDEYLTKAIALHQIPGLALAVVAEDEIVYENYFGKASLEDGNPVNEKTLFRIFSATKLISTVGIFQLIEKGALNLEDPLSKHLDGLPKHWQKIQIKNLLSHSSGLPDLIRYKSTLSDAALKKKLYEAEMEFVPGNQFSYNQTNYWLLSQIIEKMTASPFEDFILKNQFKNATDGVLFSSNSQQKIRHRANRYYYNQKSKGFIKDSSNNGKRGHAGNGLNITLKSFIQWDKQLNNDELLNKSIKSKMWSPFQFANDFTYQKDAFLHGWNVYDVNQLESYGFSGGNLAAFRKFPKSNTTIILLSNGYETPAFDIIINDIARLAIPELRNKGLSLEEDIMRLVRNHQLDMALQSLKKLKEENPKTLFDNLKWNINGFGNTYAWREEQEKAFKLYEFNAKAHPNWWVGLATLAEAFDAKKDTINAIKHYQRAIVLNEKNEFDYNGQMTTRIHQLQKD